MKLIIIIFCQLFYLNFYIAFVHLQTLMTLGARVPLASVMPLLAANTYLTRQQPYNSYTPYPGGYYPQIRNGIGGYYPWATGMRRFLPIYPNGGYPNTNSFGYGYGNGMYPSNGIYNGNYDNNYYPNDNSYGNRRGVGGYNNNNYGNGRVNNNDDDYGTNSYDRGTTGSNYQTTQMKSRNKSSYRGK
ncbi:uncharacterized protein LOC113797246 [Dermatophagoides pteronyssinus]|uniref:uncharacterized protein LOC113797246 n=1 Tax=Dermatophagoides pteronyssinus TaxID=6956 RepID=UPI003F676BEC